MEEEIMFPATVPISIKRELITGLTWPYLKAEQEGNKSKIYNSLTARKIVKMCEGDEKPTKIFLRWVRVESKHYAKLLLEDKDDPRSKEYRQRMHDMIMEWREGLSE